MRGFFAPLRMTAFYFLISIGKTLDNRLSAESGAGNGGSAVIAEDGGWVDGVAACVAASRR